MITIDCSLVHTPQDLHRLLRAALSFPDWYGANLDALHDCLGTMHGTLFLLNWSAAESALGRYGSAARRAMEDAASGNPDLTVIFS